MFVCSVQAQNIVSTSSRAYSNLSSKTTITNFNPWRNLADSNFEIAMPFPITIYGQQVDTLFVIDGTVVLENGLFFGSLAGHLDRGFGSQLSRSEISHSTTGTTGNRVFTIEYRNLGFEEEFETNSTLSDSVTFSIRFLENGNKGEIHFGNSTLSGNSLVSGNVTFMSVGLFDILDNGVMIEGNPSNPIETTDLTNSNGLSTFPGTGTVYTFNFNNSNSLQKEKINPAPFYVNHNKLFIQNTLAQNNEKIVVFNTKGQIVKEIFTVAKTVELNLPAGVYFAKSASFSALKFVIE